MKGYLKMFQVAFHGHNRAYVYFRTNRSAAARARILISSVR